MSSGTPTTRRQLLRQWRRRPPQPSPPPSPELDSRAAAAYDDDDEAVRRPLRPDKGRSITMWSRGANRRWADVSRLVAICFGGGRCSLTRTRVGAKSPPRARGRFWGVVARWSTSSCPGRPPQGGSDEARQGRKGTPMPEGGSCSGAWATAAAVATMHRRRRPTRRPDRGPHGESGGRPARRPRPETSTAPGGAPSPGRRGCASSGIAPAAPRLLHNRSGMMRRGGGCTNGIIYGSVGA